MSEEEILEILSLICNERLIDRIYDNAKSFYESSIRGRKDIDEKANWLLALTGVCLAGFLTIVGLFYDKVLGHLICPVGIALVCFFCVIALFAAAIQLYQALKARSEYREVSENDILNRETIIDTERNLGSSIPYDLYIAANMLKLGLVNYTINDKKGEWLKRGQICYLFGLGFLIIVCFTLSISLVINQIIKGV